MKIWRGNLPARCLFAVFALALGLAVLLVLAEVVIRLYIVYNDGRNQLIKNELRKYSAISEAYDQSLWEEPGVRYRRNASLELDLPDGDRLSVKINSKGFRTGEFFSAKPEGVFRVICLGGSTTVIGRTNRETYPAILEKTLRDSLPGTETEVLNLGISRYGTRDVVNLAGEAAGYRPDLVLKYNGANDLWWDYFIMLRETLPAWKKWALKSYVFRWFFWRALLPSPAVIRRDLRDGLFPPLDYINRVIERSGGRMVIITFCAPGLERLTADQKYYLDFNVRHFWGRQLGTLPLIRVEPYLQVIDIYNEALREYCRVRGVPCLDLAEIFPHDFDLYVDICHFSQEGIDQAGRLIGSRLLEKGLVP